MKILQILLLMLILPMVGLAQTYSFNECTGEVVADSQMIVINQVDTVLAGDTAYYEPQAFQQNLTITDSSGLVLGSETVWQQITVFQNSYRITCLRDTVILLAGGGGPGNSFDYFMGPNQIPSGRFSSQHGINNIRAINNQTGCHVDTAMWVIVNPPLPTMAIDLAGSSCDTISMFGAGNFPNYVVQWGNSALSAQDQSPALFVEDGIPGLDTIYLTVSDTVDGCVLDTFKVVKFERDLAFFLQANASCDPVFGTPGGAVAIPVFELAFEPVSYVYVNGTDTVTTDANSGFLDGGNYTLFIEDQTGCIIDTSFTINGSAAPRIESVTSEFIGPCIGNRLIVDNSVYSTTVVYTWSNGMVGDTIYVPENGTYAVTATNSSGCQDTASVVVSHSYNINQLVIDTTGGIFSIGLTGSIPILNDTVVVSPIGDTLSLPYFIDTAGWYYITVVDGFGCILVDSILYQPPFDTTNTSTVVLRGYGEIYAKVFPNPTSDQLTIETNEFEYFWQILDASGRLIKNGNTNMVRVSEIPQGVYFLRIQSINGVVVKRIIVQRE